MNFKNYLITLVLLAAAIGVRAEGDELITIHLNSSEKPAQIAITDVSSIVFETSQLSIKDKQYAVIQNFDYSDIIKITFNEELNTESVEEKNSNATLTLFPNPVKDNISISCDETMYGSDLCIYTLTGTLVTKQTNWNGENINVSNLNPGIYFININSTTLKFIKQ
jgi:hypothetical protein